jgi:hypothetical protein
VIGRRLDLHDPNGLSLSAPRLVCCSTDCSNDSTRAHGRAQGDAGALRGRPHVERRVGFALAVQPRARDAAIHPARNPRVTYLLRLRSFSSRARRIGKSVESNCVIGPGRHLPATSAAHVSSNQADPLVTAQNRCRRGRDGLLAGVLAVAHVAGTGRVCRSCWRPAPGIGSTGQVSRYTMRPRPRSYGESSIRTRSPRSMRIR